MAAAAVGVKYFATELLVCFAKDGIEERDKVRTVGIITQRRR